MSGQQIIIETKWKRIRSYLYPLVEKKVHMKNIDNHIYFGFVFFWVMRSKQIIYILLDEIKQIKID